MDLKFDFEYIDKIFFGDVYRPVAKVSFQAPLFKTWTDTWMVVDTGADFTILPRYLANDLGISFERDCMVDTTIGVGGQQQIYLCKTKINAKIGQITRNVPLAFFANDEVPALLGRLGFLETFDVQFLKSHALVFKN